MSKSCWSESRRQSTRIVVQRYVKYVTNHMIKCSRQHSELVHVYTDTDTDTEKSLI